MVCLFQPPLKLLLKAESRETKHGKRALSGNGWDITRAAAGRPRSLKLMRFATAAIRLFWGIFPRFLRMTTLTTAVFSVPPRSGSNWNNREFQESKQSGRTNPGGGRMLLTIAIQMYPGHSKQVGLAAGNCHAGAYAN